MNKKLIAIGNPLMGDDSIGIKIANTLKTQLDKLNIEVIIGETDIDYCLNAIEDNDFVIILDSTKYNINPGTVTITSFKSKKHFDKHHNVNYFSLHGYNLIDLINLNHIHIRGYLIGIESCSIDFNLNLSPILEKSFNNICTKIYKKIVNILNSETI
ncbi:hydrogenase maturation protease [Haloimpatiens sp. FM7330]|uniref:hydrogenase maturation protease n=1 Tax=Haloimpatiens sp. FM7330 TaxID=3298610 RepID=UPI00363F62A3